VNQGNATHHPYDQWFKALAEACLELAGEVTIDQVVHVPPERISVTFEPRTQAHVAQAPVRRARVRNGHAARNPSDQLFKALASACLGLVGEVAIDQVVHVPPQRIDVTFEPRKRTPALGVLDHLGALGPGMFEYFANPPSHAHATDCLRKRLVYAHARALQARRRREAAPPQPRLWILSAGRPKAALRACKATPMNDWPTGFWQAGIDARMCFVLLHELPQQPDTLFLRLAGRGSTGQRALAELYRLPEDHALRARAWPVAVAHRAFIMQDLKRTGDMTSYEQALAVYRGYEQRIREAGAQAGALQEAQSTLIRLLTRRFGALPEDALARIHQADHATLERWVDQVLTAQSVAEVLA
jgi:hypothetical protein